MEFGSATGRPRRIGWFDAALTRMAARVSGLWGLAITKLDVLTGIDPIRICVGYQYRGRRYEIPPPGRRTIEKVKPIFEELPGWSDSLDGARSLNDLPAATRLYVARIGELVGVPIAMVGVGADRAATIVLNNPFAD
jgi:adenylosuccinate synthase